MSQSDFVSRGQALVAGGQYQEAVKVCRLGLLGRPTTVEGRVVLGQALLALKRYDEVLAEMRVALELDHTSIPSQTLKAEALLRKGDVAAAIEALHVARQLAPADPRVLKLLGEAENSGGRPSASHPAVGFVGGDTKHYPNHPSGGGDEDSGPDSYTKPTSIAAPSAVRRKSDRHEAPKRGTETKDPTPSPDVLAVGDKSGTVEVDPNLEGVEVDDDLDFDDLAAPPAAKRAGNIGGERGSVSSSRGEKKPVAARAKKTPTVDLDDDDDLIEVPAKPAKPVEPKRRAPPGPGTAVRNAVQMPSGPLDGPTSRGVGPEPRGKPSSVPPLAQSIAAQPHSMQRMPPVPLPPIPGDPRPMLVAAMPTMAAVPPPPRPPPPSLSPASIAAAARPTIALQSQPPPLSVAQQHSAEAVDAMFGNEAPAWARATMAVDPASARSVAAANEPTARPSGIDPEIAAMLAAGPAESGAAVFDGSVSGSKRLRKPRSRLQVMMWILIGIVVIGGGVFAGFQIRSMRLQKQIAAARQHANDLAKADTWAGWTAARDSLAGIVQAAGTLENRAVLARARAQIAFEFGDGLAEAKAAVEQLAGQGGLDGDLAAAYLSLAQSDPKPAKISADAALAAAPQDAAALYVVGQAAALAGETKLAVTSLKAAFDHEVRPLYGIGLARALAATYNWEDSLAAVDRALVTTPDHPGAIIARAMLLAASGRITPNSTLGNDVHTQLTKLVAEGRKPPAEQPRGVSPAQVAFGNLALAQVDFARGDVNAARQDVNAAAGVGLDDDQRFAEEAVATLFLIGELVPAKAAADTTLTTWPASRRARISLAEIAVAAGRPNDAIEMLAKQPDVIALPLALAVRGKAKLALGDLDGARADFEAALAKIPNLEPAIVGRAWLDLATGDVDDAKKRVEARYNPAGSSAALTVVYAATLRMSGDAAARDKAKAILDKVVAGPPSIEAARAQLELARLDRDVGDYRAARAAYTEASRTGNPDARFETGLLMIEDRDPAGGHDTLEQLLKEAGDHPSANLVLETARARMLVGDHTGAAQLLELADKIAGVTKWKLERERGRLMLRKGDFSGAAMALGHALDGSGSDVETFLLAADAGTADDKSGLGDKVKKLAPDRLKGRPELSIVSGKLLIAAGKDVDAEAAYRVAKDALKAEKASSRRLAQADFGLAVIAYNRSNDPEALDELELVIEEDPSMYDAYLFDADILKNKQKAFEQAKRAVRLNADYPRGWSVLGQAAAKLGDKKALADAIAKLGALAPTSPELKQLQSLRR